MNLNPTKFNAQRYYLSDPERLKKAILRACKSDESKADSIFMSNVKPIDLEGMKAKFGKQWGKLSHRIINMIEEAVQEHIEDDDFFVVLGDGQIAVVFAAKDPARIQQQSARIGAQVNTALKKSEATKALAVGAKAVKFTEDEALKVAQSPGKIGDVLDKRQAQQEKREEEAVKKVEKGGHPFFWPVLEIARKRVSVYLAGIDHKNDKSYPDLNLSGRFGAGVDQFLIKSASNALARSQTDARLVVPVGYQSVVQEDHLEHLLKALTFLPEPDRRKITVMVRGTDAAAEQSLLDSLPTTFRGAGVDTAFEIDESNRSLAARVAPLDLSLMGLNCDAYSAEDPGIAEVLSVARRYEVPTMGVDIQGVSHSRDAKKRGFDFVSGPGVAPSMKSIGDMLELAD